MDKHAKVLVCCSFGQNRSVHVKNVLNDNGYDNVLTIGIDKTRGETILMLTEWADKILVAGNIAMMRSLPAVSHCKCLLLPIGDDRWGWRSHSDLLDRSRVVLRAFGWI